LLRLMLQDRNLLPAFPPNENCWMLGRILSGGKLSPETCQQSVFEGLPRNESARAMTKLFHNSPVGPFYRLGRHMVHYGRRKLGRGTAWTWADSGADPAMTRIPQRYPNVRRCGARDDPTVTSIGHVVRLLICWFGGNSGIDGNDVGEGASGTSRMNANRPEAPAHDSNVRQSQIFAQLSAQSPLLAQRRCIVENREHVEHFLSRRIV
jgi:hypothetical protein